MTIKINALQVENVKRVKAVKMEPTAQGLTIVGGNNNQGKTSVLDAIAWAVADGIVRYFGLPLAQPQAPRSARVNVSFGTLNLRSRPSLNSTILASLPDGAPLTVVGTLEGWYVVRYGSLTGYAASAFVAIILYVFMYRGTMKKYELELN